MHNVDAARSEEIAFLRSSTVTLAKVLTNLSTKDDNTADVFGETRGFNSQEQWGVWFNSYRKPRKDRGFVKGDLERCLAQGLGKHPTDSSIRLHWRRSASDGDRKANEKIRLLVGTAITSEINN